MTPSDERQQRDDPRVVQRPVPYGLRATTTIAPMTLRATG